MLAWPSISCTCRRSAPPASRCVAKLCRKVCGLTSGGAPARRAYRFRSSQIRSRASRRPRYESNTQSAVSRLFAANFRAFVFEVRADRLHRPSAQRRDSFLVSLAAAHAKALVEVHVAHLEPRDFRRPAAGRVEQLQQGPVAPPIGVRSAGARKQPVDLLDAEHLRHPLPQFLAAQQLGQVVAEHALQLQVAKEDFQRHDVPGDAGRRELPPGKPGHVVGQVADRKIADVAALEPGEEVLEVAAVGRHGVLGQMAFPGRVVHESLQPRL